MQCPEPIMLVNNNSQCYFVAKGITGHIDICSQYLHDNRERQKWVSSVVTRFISNMCVLIINKHLYLLQSVAPQAACSQMTKLTFGICRTPYMSTTTMLLQFCRLSKLLSTLGSCLRDSFPDGSIFQKTLLQSFC